jgi:ubiquinone biosynthesis protein
MVSVLSAVRDLGRLREISIVLVRHGFGEFVQRAGIGRLTRRMLDSVRDFQVAAAPSDLLVMTSEVVEIPSEEVEEGEVEKQAISLAVRIRLVLQDLGPSFIKLGQIASTRADVLPTDLIFELKKLQDDVPGVPYEDIKSAVETNLGVPLEQAFVSFCEKPLATASIGQVHRAVLDTPEGHRDVVVKVQRPGVGQTIARDVDLLQVLAATLERVFPETKIYSPVGIVQQFDRSISTELDFFTEAENCERFARSFANHPHIRFPLVYRQVSSKHVLTLEFFDGKKLDKAVQDGASGPRIAKIATAIIIKQIFEDGFFHADPHPGNIIIMGSNEDPVIGLIDVGMVGRLSPELRDLTIDLMIAAVRKDTYAVADALYSIGRPSKKVDMREYRSEVALVADKYLGRQLKEIDLSSMIRDLAQGAMKYGIEIPPDFMLVGKAMMTLESVAKEMDPTLDVFGEAAPYFFELLKQRYNPVRLGTALWRGFEQFTRAGYDMPMQAHDVLEDLRLGRMSLKTEDPGLPLAADRLGRRIFSGLSVAALLLSGAVVMHGGHVPTLGIVLVVLAVLVWVGHMVGDLRHALKRRAP